MGEENSVWCKEKNCGARLPGHSSLCRHAPVSQKDENIIYLSDRLTKLEEKMGYIINAERKKCREQVNLWRGKFREVKHENNKLRKKNGKEIPENVG